MLAIQRRKSSAFFALLSLPATAMGFALSVQISVLSWLLATRYGMRLDDIGLVWAAGPLAGILGQVLVGGLSDRLWIWSGRRRFFIVLGGAMAALALLLLPEIGALSRALGLASVFIVAITVALVLDLAVNVGFNPTRALIADVTADGAERTRGYTTMQVVSGSFGVAAYAIGAIFGNFALIYAAVVVVAVFALVPAFLIEEPRPARPPAADATATPGLPISAMLVALSPLWALLAYDLFALAARLAGREAGGHTAEWLAAAGTLGLVVHAFAARPDAVAPFRRVVAASALCWLGIQPIFVYLVGFLQDRMPGLDAVALGRTTSLALLALNGVAALAPLLLGRLARRFDAVLVHAAAVALMAAACLAIWRFATTPLPLYALMAVCGIGWGSVVSLPFAIMSERADPARMGLFMGLFNLSVVLPQLVASLGVGRFVAAAEDKGLVFAFAATCLAASAGLWLACRSTRVP